MQRFLCFSYSLETAVGYKRTLLALQTWFRLYLYGVGAVPLRSASSGLSKRCGATEALPTFGFLGPSLQVRSLTARSGIRTQTNSVQDSKMQLKLTVSPA